MAAPHASHHPEAPSSDGSEPHLATVLEAVAQSQPEQTALVCGDVVRTWSEFDDRAARLATLLQQAPLTLHGSVGICMRNANEYLETYFAALKVRGVPTSINYRYAEDELVALLVDCACEVLVFGAAFADRVEAVRDRVPSLRLLLMVQDGTDGGAAPLPPGARDYEEELRAAAPAAPIERSGSDPLVAYTGGTTGLPKALTYPVASRVQGRVPEFAGLVGLPDPGVPTFVDAARLFAERGQRPVGLPASPLMHNTALVTCALPSLLFGGFVVTVPTPRFEPSRVWVEVERWGVTSMSIVGDAMGRPLLQALEERGLPTGHAAPSLTTITSSGMAWNATTKTGLLAHLPQVQLVEVFGATEGLMGNNRWTKDTPVTSTPRFTPVPGLRILRDDDTEAPDGESGRIAFPVGDAVHYRGDPEKTASTFRIVDGRRYAILGDLGRRLPDGTLEPLGRGSQVVNTGGEKVYPAEVEDIVRGLEGITDCLVVGVPDPTWGQRLAAVAARSSEAVTADLVRDAVRARLAGYKVPKDVVFVPTVPRFPNGKPDVAGAAEIARAATAPATS
ncbi:AMP-binding protein [Pseudonocardia halophobica]|uniref:AMP-binding protein n=1 Tax=Pseudonocardia halophobica TaxID=29401 RepID=UPI003D8BE1C8